MTFTNLRVLQLAAALSVVLIGSQCFAQTRFALFGVEQLPQEGGSTIYRLKLAQSGSVIFGIPNDAVTFTAPGGTVFSNSSATDFASFADLGATLFGDWTVREDPDAGPDNTYSMRIAPFGLGDVASNTPFFTSPLPGSTIPTDFVLKWDPNNVTNSRGITWNLGSGLSAPIPEVGVDGTFSVGYHTTLLQPPPVPFSINVYVSTSRPNPPILGRSASLNGQSIMPHLSFEAHSRRATYQVIPEPSALILFTVCALSLGLFDRTRYGTIRK